MKNIILTAKDARELQELGRLTITKTIKGADAYTPGAYFRPFGPGEWIRTEPGDDLTDQTPSGTIHRPPVQIGDAVYIREPWKRSNEPEALIFSADFTEEDAKALGGWASPTSMPADEARRHARVEAIDTLYTETAAEWLITLQLVDKTAAEWLITLQLVDETAAEAIDAHQEPAVTAGVCKHCGQMIELGGRICNTGGRRRRGGGALRLPHRLHRPEKAGPGGGRQGKGAATLWRRSRGAGLSPSRRGGCG